MYLCSKQISAAVLFAGFSSCALAEAPAMPWSGDAELGVMVTSGNTDTQTISGKLDISNEKEVWRHNLKLAALNSSENDQTSAEKYSAMWKSDYKLGEKNYLFGSAQYDDDRFSGYDYQATLALGYGRRVLGSDSQTLDLEIGPGYRRSKVSTTDRVKEEAVLKLAGFYRYQISDSSKFKQDLVFDIGEDQTISKSITAVQAKVAESLSMKVSYTWKHTSEVPAGRAKIERETALTLVYAI